MSHPHDKSSVRFTRAMCIAAALLCGSSALADEKQPAPATDGLRVVIGKQTAIGNVEAFEASGYWIGVSCEQVGDKLRANLKLKPEEGLEIEAVIPESPAAKAGLREDDLVLTAAGKPVNQPEQLAAAVQAAKEGELKLEILRGGKRETVVVKPVKRQTPGRVIVIGEENEENEGREGKTPLRPEHREVMERLQQALRGEGVHFQFGPGPQGPLAGASLMPGASPMPPLPDNMQVTIQKSGNRPARVLVRQGEKSWSTSEKELEMLPGEARAYAARLLGKAPMIQPQGGPPGMPGAPAGSPPITWQRTFALPGGAAGGIQVEVRGNAEEKAANPQPANWLQLHRPPQPPSNIEHRLHELEEQVEQLRGQLNQLRKAPGSTAPNPPQR